MSGNINRGQTQNFARGGGTDGLNQTDGGDEVDDDEGVEDGDDGRGDGRHDVAQALQAPE